MHSVSFLRRRADFGASSNRDDIRSAVAGPLAVDMGTFTAGHAHLRPPSAPQHTAFAHPSIVKAARRQDLLGGGQRLVYLLWRGQARELFARLLVVALHLHVQGPSCPALSPPRRTCGLCDICGGASRTTGPGCTATRRARLASPRRRAGAVLPHQRARSQRTSLPRSLP